MKVSKRDWDIATRLRAGVETYEAIGNDYGLTRERIRQIGERLGVLDARRAEKQHAKQDRDNALAWEELFRRIKLQRVCLVCGGWNLRSDYYKCCSHECSRAWATARYALDEDQRAKQRVHHARSILRHADTRRPSEVEWAHRMLSDNPPPPNRRYRTRDSIATALRRKYRGD